MALDSPENKSEALGAVASAAKAYADNASSNRPLATVEKDLLDTVGKLIGKPVTTTGQVGASSGPQRPRPVTTATAPPLSTPPTDAPSVVPVNPAQPIDSPDNDD
jgi:hypothetical protein